MKKLLLISIVLSLVCATYAQTTFSVPTPTLEEKNNMTKMLLNNTILGFITLAENDGMKVEEIGKKMGELAIPFWDENGGFEPFVNFTLNSMACIADGVQIIEQSNEKLVFMVSSLYMPLESQGVLFGASHENFTTYYNAMMNVIAVHLGGSFEMTWGEEGYTIVITL